MKFVSCAVAADSAALFAIDCTVLPPTVMVVGIL